MYRSNMLNVQESTTIFNAYTKSLETYWMHYILRPAVVSAAQIWLGMFTSLGIPRTPLQAVTFLRGARFIAWRLRRLLLGECRWVWKHFWNLWVRLSHGPVPGPTLKRPCTTLVRLVERSANTADVWMVETLTVILSGKNKTTWPSYLHLESKPFVILYIFYILLVHETICI